MKSFNAITLVVSGALLLLQITLFALTSWATHIADARCRRNEEQMQQERKLIVEQVQEERRLIAEQFQSEEKKMEETVIRINREFLGTVEKMTKQFLRDVDRSLSR